MKENMLEVLMYLFDHYISDQDYILDQGDLMVHLEEAGFGDEEVSKAFEWLDGLNQHQPVESSVTNMFANSQPDSNTLRIYSSEEARLMGAEGIGFLLYLEQNGILDNGSREQVLERVWALGLIEVDLEQLKWVVLMVLFNQPDQKSSLSWLEDIIFSDQPKTIH